MSSKGKFALVVGLLAGAATGVLFTPTSGKKFRDKLKKDVKKGGYGKESLWKHFEGMANEIKDAANESYDGSKLDKKVTKATGKAKATSKKVKSTVKGNVKKAKTVAKKSKKIAKEAVDDIKDEITENFGEKAGKPSKKKKS